MALTDIDKAALMAVIDRAMSAAVERSTAQAKRSAESAVHDESRAEDSKDTRAIEESYLARGQAARAAELEVDRATLRALQIQDFTDGRPIAASALVEIADDGGMSRTLLLVPRAGGRNFYFGGREITLATPASPLGRALLGASEGDEVEALIRGTKRLYEILGVV
jgi:transcription elongation GreA/GreB family factor